jgi:hypothetical protein
MLIRIQTRGGGGGNSTSVECLFSWSAVADVVRRSRRVNVVRVTLRSIFNVCRFTRGSSIQHRSSACAQQAPYLAVASMWKVNMPARASFSGAT